MHSIELNKQLEKGVINNIYLFYGPEDYIKDTYIKKITKLVLGDDEFNLTIIDELPSKDELMEVIESVPMMSEKKVVILNCINIISSSLKKEIKNIILEILKDVPPYTILIIKEYECDTKKISKPVLREIEKSGVSILCSNLQYADMLAFANREFNKYNKKIKKDDLEYLLSILDGSIHSVLNEIEKICLYANDIEIITKEHIDLLVKKSIEDRVFSLSDAIIKGDKQEAYSILNDLKLLKNQHPAPKIFAIVCDHICNMYLTIINSNERVSNKEIINVLEIYNRPFLINQYLKQSRFIDLPKLRNLITKCNNFDYKIKNGLVEPYYALEEIIATS